MDEVDITVTDLSKKHQGKPAYKGILALTKRTYHDDREVVIESSAADKENMEILRDRIMAILIDEIKPTRSNHTKLV